MENPFETKKMIHSEIPDEASGPCEEENLRPSLGGRIGALQGPLSLGDLFFFDPPVPSQAKLENERKNKAEKLTDPGIQLERNFFSETQKLKSRTLEGHSLLFREKKTAPRVSPLEEMNRRLVDYVSLIFRPAIPASD
jgi:hypothetical protein